jgi:hypothetical protein
MLPAFHPFAPLGRGEVPTMSKLRMTISMSLDGYVAGPSGA